MSSLEPATDILPIDLKLCQVDFLMTIARTAPPSQFDAVAQKVAESL
jgi:hypothetical protein